MAPPRSRTRGASTGLHSPHAPLLLLLLALALPGPARPAAAQEASQETLPGSVELRGTVSDISGAVMQAVRVRVFAGAEDLSDGREPLREVSTDAEGRFAVPVPPGLYRVEAFAPAFALFDEPVTAAAASEPLDIVLDLDIVELEIDVTPTDELLADTTMSLTSVRLSGDELLGLPNNEEDLAAYLMLLAGADFSGDLEEDIVANFVIDGFDEGRLPSPDQIAQIIVDPNSMSADGSGPRIEVITRPGTGRWRRSVDFGFGDESLNARTPGEVRKEPRQTRDWEFQVAGPIIPGRMEVELEVTTRSDERAGNSLRAIAPAGDVFAGVVRPEDEHEFGLDTEFELSAGHSLDLGFSYGSGTSLNEGVGGFTLPERGSRQESSNWRFAASERSFGSDYTNGIQFQLRRSDSTRTPAATGFAVDVADAFRNGGGTSRGSSRSTTAALDNRLRLERGDWNLQWQTELEYSTDFSVDENNYNGTFDFASLHDYCYATGFTGVNCAPTQALADAAAAQGVAPVYTDAAGRLVEITGLPTTFTQASGDAELRFDELGYNTSFQADKRFGQRASLRLGVQWTGTNHSLHHFKLNPTINSQFRLTPNTIVSAGAQLRYRDFRDTERLLRNDGSTRRREIAVSNPTFPDPFAGGEVEVTEETSSLWVLAPDYEAPYSISPRFSVTQQVPGGLHLNVDYSLGYGRRQRRTRNINAPFPGTPLPDGILDLPFDERQEIVDRMRPFYPVVGNITQIESTGRSSSRNLRIRVQPRGNFDFFGLPFSGNLSYSHRTGFDDDDFNNPYAPEWGPTQREHQVQTQFRVRTPDTVSWSNGFLRALGHATVLGTNYHFNLRANSGRLYSITTGTDLNGDQSTRDRPAGMARNTEVGPALWDLDMTLTKDIRIGGAGVEGGGGRGGRGGARAAQGRGGGRGGRGGFEGGFGRSTGHRLRLQVRVNNLLNRSQARGYSGVLTSPLFGKPTGFTGGRTITLGMNLDF